MNEQVLHELCVVGDFMLKQDPDVTLIELLATYFGHVTGEDYSKLLNEPPDDADIIKFHISGCTPQQIAGRVDDDAEYIFWLLGKYGFAPNDEVVVTDGEKSVTKYRIRKVKKERAVYEGLVNDGILT